MCDRTRQNTINALIGNTAMEILGPNPKRKAFIFMPLAAGGISAPPVMAVAFSPGAGQLWTVPQGVTTLLDGYVWAAGGNGFLGNMGDAGGGGGGGGFSNTGPLTVIPGTIYTITVPAAASEGVAKITNPAAVDAALANSGINATDANGAAGGADGTGSQHFPGKIGRNKAAAPPGRGGGGGGAAGSFAQAASGSQGVGGIGGGTVTRTPYGVGGNGGNGGLSDTAGSPGTSPGGGGGGGGVDGGGGGGAGGVAADGLVVLFYALPESEQSISMSLRSDVVSGRGVLNYIPGSMPFPIITDEMIGDAIQLPWWIISAIDLLTVQIVEVSYDE